MQVTLIDGMALGRIIEARTHWIVVFAPSHYDYVDKLDDALAVYPTFPTVFGLVALTIIPKRSIGRKRMNRALVQIGAAASGLGGEQDIAVIADDIHDVVGCLKQLHEWSTVALP